MNFITKYKDNILNSLTDLDENKINKALSFLKRLKKVKGRLFIIGVGGSAGNASHAVNDFRKLCDIDTYTPIDNISEITAKTNDDGFHSIFDTYLICEINSILKEFSFDLTIADEAHNCTGRTDTYFGNILNDEKIRTTKKLFFTATPRILSKRIKTASRQHEIDVASMDDKSLFGEVFHKLNFSEAIKKKILSDYQVSIVGVENKQISEMIRVLQPGGGLFICTPDYRQFYEPHYKLPLPMFLPKIVNKILLKIFARPTTFLDTLNLFNEKDINKILNQHNVTATRIYECIPKEWTKHPSFQIKIIKYITIKFGIHKNQYWFIKKNL